MAFRIFVLSLALLAADVPISSNLPSHMNYCAGGDEEYISRPAFLFEPEMTNTPQWSPLYLTWNRYFNNSWEVDSVVSGDNIKEWNDYFGGGLPMNDVKFIIYQAEPIHLLDVQVKWKFKQFHLDPSIETNKLVQRLVTKPDQDFLQYIIFAKSCEPFVTSSDYWEPQNSHKGQEDSLRILARQAEQAYYSCSSSFLKLRYAYQIVRLLRYAEDWDSSIHHYDKLVTPLNVHSVIQYWALEQKAGALCKLNRHGEGAYLFSKVFTECPSRRSVAYSSFSITSDTVWNDCMNQCKTIKERTSLYFLRGINPRNSVMDEMKNIYALDPGSEYLPVLLTREINRLESDENASESDDEVYWANKGGRRDTTAVHTLRQFIQTCLIQKSVIPIDMWQLASSYFQFLDGDEGSARKTLAALKTNVRLDKVRDVIPRFEVYYDVASLKKLDDTMEDALFTRILATNHDKLRAYTILKYQQLYNDRHDTIKAYLCSHGLSDLKLQLDLTLTEKVIGWSNKQLPTSFDKFLLDHRLFEEGYERYMSYTGSGAQGKNGLLEVKGTILLGDQRLQEAMAIYKLIPEDEQWKSTADPFTSRISDCRDCDFRDNSQKKYTHLSLIQTILDYEHKLKTDPKHAMEYHRLLGNVYYNLTHFGNAAEGLTFHHNCDRSFYTDAGDYKKTGVINFDVDCSLAREHYLEAMQLAEASGNLEFAAECCFMAAKCEQNEYYVTVISDDENHTMKNKHYKTYFNRMKAHFSTTQFYNKAIRECKYFNNFISRK